MQVLDDGREFFGYLFHLAQNQFPFVLQFFIPGASGDAGPMRHGVVELLGSLTQTLPPAPPNLPEIHIDALFTVEPYFGPVWVPRFTAYFCFPRWCC